jgi:hypothetical protein
MLTMNLLLIASALAGFAGAIGHSYLSERFVLRPLLAAREHNRPLHAPAMRRLMRWIWHLPSFAWAQVAAATLWFAFIPEAIDASTRTLLAFLGVGIYATSAFFNALALRGPHVGNIILGIAALTLWFGLYG